MGAGRATWAGAGWAWPSPGPASPRRAATSPWSTTPRTGAASRSGCRPSPPDSTGPADGRAGPAFAAAVASVAQVLGPAVVDGEGEGLGVDEHGVVPTRHRPADRFVELGEPDEAGLSGRQLRQASQMPRERVDDRHDGPADLL